MTPDGEAGEPAYVTSETSVVGEFLLLKYFSINFKKDSGACGFPCYLK